MRPEVDLYFAENPDGQPITKYLIRGIDKASLVVVIRQLPAGDHDFRFSILRMRTLEDTRGEGFVKGVNVPGPMSGPNIARLNLEIGDLTSGFVVCALEIDGEFRAEVTLQVSRES